jgi:hypothetical protein
VFDGGIPPSEVFGMDEDMLMEADAGLDLYIEKINKATKKGTKGGGKHG